MRPSSTLAADVPLQVQMWYFVAATFDAGTGRAMLYQVGVGNRYNGLLGKVALVDYDSRTSAIFRHPPGHLAGTPFLMAGSRGRDAQQRECVSELYCGKIDRCGAFDQALQPGELDAIRSGLVPAMESLVAYWDTSEGYTDRGIGDVVVDVGRHRLNARGYNRPVRGQTGWNWNGFTDCFRLAPHEFGGIEVSCRRADGLQLEADQGRHPAGRAQERLLCHAAAFRQWKRLQRGARRLLRAAAKAARANRISVSDADLSRLCERTPELRSSGAGRR